MTILQLEKTLRLKVEALTKEKEARMAELKELKDVEQQLCDMLCTTPYYIPTGTIPSTEQLETLQEHISTLKAERVITVIAICNILFCFNLDLVLTLTLP